MVADPKKKAELKRKARDLQRTLDQVKQATGEAYIVRKRAEIADFCGVSLGAVTQWMHQGCPGTRERYDLKAIVQWLRTQGPWRPLGGNRGTAEDLERDEDEGPESEWSEEYRKWKAKKAELDYHREIGALISVELFDRVIAESFGAVRRFAERQIAQHGNGTAKQWQDALEQFEATIDDVTRQSSDSNGTAEMEMGGEPIASPPPTEPE